MFTVDDFEDEFDVQFKLLRKELNYYVVDLKEIVEIWYDEICDHFVEIFKQGLETDEYDFVDFPKSLQNDLYDEIQDLADSFSFESFNNVAKAVKELRMNVNYEASINDIVEEIRNTLVDNANDRLTDYMQDFWNNIIKNLFSEKHYG